MRRHSIRLFPASPSVFNLRGWALVVALSVSACVGPTSTSAPAGGPHLEVQIQTNEADAALAVPDPRRLMAAYTVAAEAESARGTDLPTWSSSLLKRLGE